MQSGCRYAKVPLSFGMCCFTGPVQDVSDTSIFARVDARGEQNLVYQMRLDAAHAVAMVLPLPVRPGLGEGALQFINLEAYPEFFDDLHRAFPVTRVATYSTSPPVYLAAGTLTVHQVGDFVASYVPSIKDFARLDKRFRLPEGTWEAFPQYKHYGFAVFQLKKGKTKVHPMAMRFPAANPKLIYFPTVHIHDGEIHAEEHFDHTLYCQGHFKRISSDDWDESTRHADATVKLAKSKGLVHGGQHLYRHRMEGTFRNTDLVMGLS